MQPAFNGSQQTSAVQGSPLQQSELAVQAPPPGEQQLLPTQPPAQQSVAAVHRTPLALQHSPWRLLEAPVQAMPLQQSAAVSQALPPGAQQRLPVQTPMQQSASV